MEGKFGAGPGARRPAPRGSAIGQPNGRNRVIGRGQIGIGNALRRSGLAIGIDMVSG